MKLIPHFEMNPFTRIIWVNQEAKDAWGPILSLVNSAFYQLELLSVREGIRKATTMHCTAEELVSKVDQLAQQGLVFRPITRVGSYEGFAHAHPAVEDGKPWSYYGSVGTPEAAEAFAQASSVGDHDAIGELLGYPECCRKFFTDVWTTGYYDPVWQAAAASDTKAVKQSDERFLRIAAYPEVLSLLRYIGIRLTPQIPCSGTCEPSRQTGQEWLSLGRDQGLGEEVERLLEVLSWPMEWTCLHGIAEIRTPLFKVSTNSMPTFEKYTVQVVGTGYPELAPTGLAFPYHRPEGVMLTHSPSFERAEQQILVN